MARGQFNVRDGAGTSKNFPMDTVTNSDNAPYYKVMDGRAGNENLWQVDADGMARVRMAPLQRTPVAAANAGARTYAVGGSAIGLTIPATATHALISVETNPIRWWDDGTTPTASVGMLLAAPDYMWIEALTNFSMIATTGTASVTVCFYKYI